MAERYRGLSLFGIRIGWLRDTGGLSLFGIRMEWLRGEGGLSVFLG